MKKFIKGAVCAIVLGLSVLSYIEGLDAISLAARKKVWTARAEYRLSDSQAAALDLKCKQSVNIIDVAKVYFAI